MHQPDYADAHDNLGAARLTNVKEGLVSSRRRVAPRPAAQFNLAVAYGSSSSLGPAKEAEQLRKSSRSP